MEANFVLFLLPSMPHHIFCGKRRQGKTKKEGTQEDENYRASGDTSYTALKEKRLRDQSGFIALLRRKREKWTEGKKSPPQKRKRRNPRRNLSLARDTQRKKMSCVTSRNIFLSFVGNRRRRSRSRGGGGPQGQVVVDIVFLHVALQVGLLAEAVVTQGALKRKKSKIILG